MILGVIAEASILVSSRTPSYISAEAKQSFSMLSGINTFAFYNEYPDFRHRTSAAGKFSAPFVADTNFSSIVYSPTYD